MAKQKEPQPEAPAVQTIRMVRSAEICADGPLAADVHPDEVANYSAGGWVIDTAQ